MKNAFKIARKEFAGFFSSPIAFIFLGAFLVVTLFVFFWVERFFSRNIADIRPMFEWMPVLLIFLVGSITMRMWSEERRAGTLEFLLTSPVRSYELVLGKFLACMGLVAVALIMTLPLPVSVSLLGPLDWGPTIVAYLATLFLAAAYASIGLFVSACFANQILSLIITAAAGGFFYLLGDQAITGLFGTNISEILGLMGTGSRFDSIARGVLDLRDLYYYLSLVGTFLSLNVLTLEWLRWAGNKTNPNHRRWYLVTALFALNVLAANLWLAPLGWIRTDVTEGRMYSISEPTRNILAQLREPLLVRGYFSAQTHPLLAPLVPRLRDLLEEYAVAGGDRLRLEFIDPKEHPELEKEANEKFGVKPVPFQFASKYETSVVNSYFNIVFQYGDQFEVLGFQDLIDIMMKGEADLDVDLRNPEYDMTRAIKKVLYAYQGSGELFSNIPHPVSFKGYISDSDRLPDMLKTFRTDLDTALKELQDKSEGKLTVEILNPETDKGLAEKLQSDFGLRPMTASLFDGTTFWFYMTMEGDGRIIQVPLPEELNKAGLERGLQAALKRFSKGFLKTVALSTPPNMPPGNQFGMPASGMNFEWLRQSLSEDHNVLSAELGSGQVSDEADLLLIAAPERMDDKELFAVDQFLMRGGTVIVASNPFKIQAQAGLLADKQESPVNEWLEHHGITPEDRLVLDPQNAALPIPVERRVGGMVFQDTRMMAYPFFVDIRNDGMNKESPMTSALAQVTLTWPSPIDLDPEKNKDRTVVRLLESSEQSWTTEETSIQPDFQRYGQLGFPAGDQQGRELLGVMVEGRFESFFKDKPSPLAAVEEEKKPAEEVQEEGDAEETPEPVITRVIDHSTDSARIILFASDDFFSDEVLQLATSGMGSVYLKPVELLENAIDWSLEDRDLLTIRSRARFSRTLDPVDKQSQMFWEYLNYSLAVFGLLIIWLIRGQARKSAKRRYTAILGQAV